MLSERIKVAECFDDNEKAFIIKKIETTELELVEEKKQEILELRKSFLILTLGLLKGEISENDHSTASKVIMDKLGEEELKQIHIEAINQSYNE